MNYSVNNIISALAEKFEDILIEFSEIQYCGSIPVFFIKAQQESQIKESWQAIVDFIALNFQTDLTDEFAVWNIYLFFVFQETIDDALKYQIENDTFSSRKIVIENELSNQEIIDEHIINRDLDLGKSHTGGLEFRHDDIIWGFLKGKEAKKKITDEDKAIFKKMAGKIKGEANEN